MKHQSITPKGTSGGGGASRKAPGRDGNLHTSHARIAKRDFFGNHRGARKPSAAWCFISTACAEARGMADDCYELALLRLFREEHVARLPEGEAALAAYREKAPRIVAAVEALGESAAREVWEEVYERGVKPAVALITNGSWDEAYELYSSMCAELEERFLRGDLADESHPMEGGRRL